MIELLAIIALPALLSFLTGRQLSWKNNGVALGGAVVCIVVVPLAIWFALSNAPVASHNIAAALNPEYNAWHGRHHRGVTE